MISIYHLAPKSNTSEYKRKIEFLKEEYQSQLFFASNDSSRLAIVTIFNGRGMLSDKIPSILHKNHVPILLISSTEYDPEIEITLKENHYKKISSYNTKLSLLFVLDTLYTAYLGDIMKRILKRRQSTIIKMTGE
mgnify:FL=1